ncbi:MAG: hypothetical protein QG652_1281 [Pseudomonadota bacterium]|nr:hypothetical protein [Pseudomonadota bacterium]
MNQFNEKSVLPQEMPFEFTGTARQYFGIWIVNLLLTIITLGIYSAWAKVRTKRYFYGNTLLGGSPFDYLADPLAILKGWAIAVAVLIAYNLSTNIFPVSSLLLLPLMMIVLPWVVVRAMCFRARNSAWRNIRFGFKKSYGEAAMVFILFPVLIIITLGLFLPYYYYAMNRFMVNNSGYGTTLFQFHATAKDFYRIFLKPMLAMLVVIVIILAAVIVPAYKEYGERARTMMEEMQNLQNENSGIIISDEELAANEADMYVAEEPDAYAMDEEAAINPDVSYEDQSAEMLEQAMQDLANAEADMANTDMAGTDMTFEDVPDNLADGDVQVDVLEPLGSGDEEFAGMELPPESAMQTETAEGATAEENMSLEDMAGVAAAMSLLIMLFMFLFYLAFIAYVQSRIWNLVYNSTELAGHRFRSDVRARDIIWLYVSNLLVVSLTFGLMIPWAKIRLARYRASKLVFLPAGNLDTFMQAQQKKISALGEEMGDVFDLDIGI